MRRLVALSVITMLFGCSGDVGQSSPSGSAASSSTPGATGTTGTSASSGPTPVGTTMPGTIAAPAPAPTPGVKPVAVMPAPVAPLGSASVELPLRRLTQTQYVNTLQDVVRRALATDGAAIAATVPALVTQSAQFPADQTLPFGTDKHGGYLRTDQRLTQGHVDAEYAVATSLAATMTGSSARMTQLMGACATATGSAASNCLTAFVQKFGRLALRRPLTGAEVSFYAAVAGSAPVQPAAVADVVALILAAPQFFYVVENGQPTTATGAAIPLTAHELAARLSYHFWQTLPDDTLGALADSGELLKAATYAAQVQRLAADARTNQALREFFVQWFRLADETSGMAPLDSRVGDPVFTAFAGSFVPTATSSANAVNEVADMVQYLSANGGTLQNVLTDKRNFARTSDIAGLYGMPAWNGSSAPAAFTDPTRAGLLTRVALLASGSPNTRPIMKGVRARNALLCQALPPPPANAAGVIISPSSTATTRQVVETLTQGPGSSCAACHQGIINPLGFVTENFDALGRARTLQTLYDANGKVVSSQPVSTIAVPAVLSADARTAADANQATQYILDSGEFERCFAQQYFRFTFARKEAAADQGVLTDLQAYARSGQSLRTLLSTVALRAEFQMKDFR